MVASALIAVLALGQLQTPPRISVEVGALITVAPCPDDPEVTCDNARLIGPSEVLTRPAWVALSTAHEQLQRDNAALTRRVEVLEASTGLPPAVWIGLGVVLGVGTAFAVPLLLR